MSKIEEIKQKVRDNIEFSIGKSKRPIGGQSCGIEHLPIILKSEELEIEISINHFKSKHQNKDYGKMIFDLIIDDLVK